MDPLTQGQLNAMTQAGNKAPIDALSDTQLKALTGSTLSPDRSATLLGHATSLQEKMLGGQVFTSPLQNIAAGRGADNLQSAIGAGKQGLVDFASAGAQNSGPIGKAMLAHAPAFSQDIQGLNKATQPSNVMQQQGAAQTQLAEAAPGIAEIPGAIKNVGELVASPLKDFLSDWNVSRATNAIASTAKTMTKGEQTAATEEGRLTSTITGAGKFTPSTTEQNAGQLLSGKVGSNPIKNVPIIQDEIAAKGREAEQFLGQNGRPVTPDEADQAFQTAKEKASRYLAPEQQKNYDHTIEQFKAELKDIAGTDPIAQNTGTYYKALKNFEQNVTSRLRQGNEALLSDSGSAQLQAAKDVRNTVRDIIGEKHPEFKKQMYDLASLYDAKDNVITKAVARDTFQKAHPVISKGLKYGAEAVGAGAVYEGAKKLGLPLP